MSCRRAWDRRLLASILPKTFLDTALKHHRQDILLSQEKSRIPQTIQYISVLKEQRVITSQIYELEKQKKEITRQIRELRYRLYSHNMAQRNRQNLGNRFQRPCPNDECRGYLDSASGLCGLCGVETCLECNIQKGSSEEEEHVCKDEDVTLWKSLSDSTKCCPSCQVRIFKVSGCNQMWCPNCHTAFNWVTGTIEQGQVHNPHYYEWLFSRGGGDQNDAQQECPQGIPSASALMRVLTRDLVTDSKETKYWRDLHRLTHHLDRVEIPRLRAGTAGDENQDLRVRFLENMIDEKRFMSLIQTRDKRKSRETEIRRICEMFRDVSSDIMRRVMTDRKWAEAKESREALVNYFNTCMSHVAKDFSCKAPMIVVEEDGIGFYRHATR